MIRYAENTKARAVRLVREHRDDYESQWAAMKAVSGRLGMNPETLRKWVRQAEIDAGEAPGVSSEEARELRVSRVALPREETRCGLEDFGSLIRARGTCGAVTRRGSGTAGDISAVAIPSLGDSRVVAAMRNGSGDLQLIVWDIDGAGNLTRGGSGTAGGISLVAIVARDPSRVVAAMQNGSGDLQLIVWDIDGAGNLTRGGSGEAGDISAVAITSLGDSRVVAAMRNGSGDLQLIAWGRITDNFTFDPAFTNAQRATIIERHQFAFGRIQPCMTLENTEKGAVTSAINVPLHTV